MRVTDPMKATDTVMSMGIMRVTDPMKATDIMMSMGIMKVPADMEEIDHVEIYQTVPVFCHNRGLIHDGRGAHGSDSAGHYEPDCR